MKKLMSLACLFLCVVLLCTSCAKDVALADFYADKKYEDSYPTLNTFTDLSQLTGLDYVKSFSEIVVFDDDDREKVKFYNVEKNSFVVSLDDEYLTSYSFFSVLDNTFIITVEKDSKNDEIFDTNIYDANGNLMLTKESYSDLSAGYASVVKVASDLFQFDKKIYRVDNNGAIFPVVTNPFYGDIPSFDRRTSTYYYDVEGNSVSAYNKNLECVFYWEVPYTTYDDCMISVLSSEKVLVQVIDILPETETKYDYVDEKGNKCKLTSTIVDVATGKEKNVKLDYLVATVVYTASNLTTDDYLDYIPEDITDIAYICYIEDQKVLSATSSFKLVALNPKDAKVASVIAPEFDTLPTQISETRYLYTKFNGETYLIDITGKVISKISGSSALENKNESYIVKDGKLYDYDLREIYDAKANKKDIIMLLGHNVILRDSDGTNKDYYLYTKNGEVVEVNDFYLPTYSAEKQFFATYSEKKNEYTFYNEYNKFLGSVDDAMLWTVVYTFEDNAGVIIAVADLEGNVTYHQLGK